MTTQRSQATATVTSLLARVQAFGESRGLAYYLVGGFLRDQLLGRVPASLNVDLILPQRAMETTRELAAHLRGAFVPLDQEAGVARIVVETSEGSVELDVGDFRHATLDGDLRLRDFTSNAIAVRLQDWLKHPTEPQPLIDPLRGCQALAARRLIACFPGAFTDDPLRILRAFRLAAQLAFSRDPAMEPLMASAVSGLARVSGERIRDELLALFDTDEAGDAVATLSTLGALEVLIPELMAGAGVAQGGFHHLDVLEHQLEAVRQADRILADCGEFAEPLRSALVRYCREQPVDRRSRKGLIKLGALLHDIGKPHQRQVHDDGEIWFIGHEHAGAELAEPIVQRLRLSNREAEIVVQLVRHHLRPGFLSREPQLTRKAIYRFYKDLGDNGPACVLTWWSDRMATRGPLSRVDQIEQQRERTMELLNAYFFKAEAVVRPPRLIDGHRLMRELRLTPGPTIGKLLAAIEEAQAEGRIASAEDALALAQDYLHAR